MKSKMNPKSLLVLHPAPLQALHLGPHFWPSIRSAIWPTFRPSFRPSVRPLAAPSGPPSGPSAAEESEESNESPPVEEASGEEESVPEEDPVSEEETASEEPPNDEQPPQGEEASPEEKVGEEDVAEEQPVPDETPAPVEDIIAAPEPIAAPAESSLGPVEPSLERTSAAEAEVARLSAEVARLRQSMAGAAEVIEDLETPPMPPAVLKDIVIGAHIVSDFARLARQLDREQLIRATMGTIAMLHPDQPSVMISTRNMAMLPRLDERGLCAARLGGEAPQFAPEDWRTLEVVLASASLATGGPAAVIHSHGAYTTAASCEKDLVVVSPIDEIGKRNIGKVVIVDPDDENPDDFLRQIMEALQQGGMRCVVVRGRGAYAVGRDLDQAWANAAMVEHSMRIVLLARQANLKI